MKRRFAKPRSPQRRRNVATVDGGNVGGGFQRQRLGRKGLRYVVGRHFPPGRLPLM